MKYCTFFLLFLSLSFSVLAEEPITYSVVATSLMVREQPDRNAPTIGRLKDGEMVQVVADTGIFQTIEGTTASWVRIKLDDKREGFAFGAYISQGNTEKGSIPPFFPFLVHNEKVEKAAVAASEQCYLFQAPSRNSTSSVRVEPGYRMKLSGMAIANSLLERKDAWYVAEYRGKTGFVSAEDIAIDPVRIGNRYYSVIESADSRSMYPVLFIQTKSELRVYSSEFALEQRMAMPDASDQLRIVSDPEIQRLFPDTIIVEHRWNHETCCPIGYSARTVFAVKEDGTIADPLFRWFDSIGAQDAPYATLIKRKIGDQSIRLEYEYYDSIGFPGLGHGLLVIEYDVRHSVPVLLKIESQVVQTHQFIDNSYSRDEEHRLKEPLQLEFNRTDLNEKFRYMSKVYSFIF